MVMPMQEGAGRGSGIRKRRKVSAVNGGPGRPRRNKMNHISPKDRKHYKWVKGGRLVRKDRI